MSFNIAVAMDDLVVLVSDRRGANLPNNYVDGMKEQIIKNRCFVEHKKLFPIGKNIYGVGLGWTSIYEPWLHSFNRFRPYPGWAMRLIGFLMKCTYNKLERILKKAGITVASWGLTWVTIGGFISKKACICNFSSEYNFRPRFFRQTFIYSRIKDLEAEMDDWIKNILRELLSLKHQSISFRRVVFMERIKPLMLELSKRYDAISFQADIVFITENDSVCESLE